MVADTVVAPATAAAVGGGGGACIVLEGLAMCPLNIRRIISRPEERWVGRGAREEEEGEGAAAAAGVGEEEEGEGEGLGSALSSVRDRLFFFFSFLSRFLSSWWDFGGGEEGENCDDSSSA